eukprot:INCI17644.3.p1 GENE.INCI17644.3~~INCI17644.3.p1  ORF type:complete len:301 (+),score=55.10 INCI17644.3:758-1660(+)
MQLNGLTKEALISRWMVTRQLVAAHETENGRKKPNGAKPATIEELPTEDELKYMKKSALVQRVQALHSRLPSRQECRTAGVPIPGQLRDALTSELRCLEWSATKHRKITAKHYLVLKRLDNSAVALGAAQSVGGKTISSDTSTMSSNQDDAMYSKLQQLAGELMQWVDPLSCWTHIAVTKNFIGAPHIDRFDISYQYAVSLGSFDESTGGQLCVDAWTDAQAPPHAEANVGRIFVVNTKNRVARMDGRYLHWVRTYDTEKSDRFSLIFYQVSGEGTAIAPQAVDAAWMEQKQKSVSTKSE